MQDQSHASSQPKTVNSSNHTHFLRLSCHIPVGSDDDGVTECAHPRLGDTGIGDLRRDRAAILNFHSHST